MTCRRLYYAAFTSALAISAPALAQQAADAPSTNAPQPGAIAAVQPDAGGDIIVTARKRDETLISVPVVVSVVGAAEIQRRGITDLVGLAQSVPQLLIAPTTGATAGGDVSIRGISGPDANPFADTAVSFNVDGVQVAKASVLRLSDIDLAQVEVLKGPQALFFGKNSPAGIVSIRTADPTDRFEAKLSSGYEFYAREIRSDGYVSGPLTDHLGVRLAGYYSHMDGYLIDQTPASTGYAPDSQRQPRSNDLAVRGTVKWEPSARLTARLKVSYAQDRNNGAGATNEFIYCGLGDQRAPGLSNSQCHPGQYVVNASSGPVVGSIPATLNFFGHGGQNYQHLKQFLTGLEVNYHLSDTLLLTSVSGLYTASETHSQNFEQDYDIILPASSRYTNRELSQELRLTSSFDSPVNFTTGAYFADTHSVNQSLAYIFARQFDLIAPGFGGPTTPALLTNYGLVQDGKAYSAFLQMTYKPIEKIEIDLGGRYSYESKRLPLVRSGGGLSDGTPAHLILDASTEQPVGVRKKHWTDFSPEATISYRPSRNLTMFGSYKHGFLSGGFNSAASNYTVPNLDLSYNPQTIQGFEAGVKSSLMGGALRLNAAAYTYNLKGLQVSNYSNATNTIRNAGAVKIQGVEGDFAYRPPLAGLSLHGAASYNHGIYTSYPNAPCYPGETGVQGCRANGTQDLGGTELVRAPKWNLAGGADLDRPLAGDLVLGVSANVTYSSSYLTDATSAPTGRAPKYTLLDGSVRVGDDRRGWELALIGRNLTDRHYFTYSVDVPFFPTDRFGTVVRGRQLLLRATYKIQ